jgi:hypothetical protein
VYELIGLSQSRFNAKEIS